MAKEISTISSEIMDRLINPGYTGNESSEGGRKFPPVINILQSDKQYEAFGEDGNSITKAMYGKLFVRTQEKNTLSDLKDSIEGTVIKVETGYEILADVNGKQKIVESGTGTMNKDTKASYLLKNPNHTVRNMVKVILCPVDDIASVKASIAKGVSPFCVLTIKGSNWGEWFDAQKKMDELSMASTVYQNKKASQLFVSVFRFVVTSRQVKSDDGSMVWYEKAIAVKLNTPELAYEFYPFVMETKEYSLFYDVRGQVEAKEVDIVTGAIAAGVGESKSDLYERELKADFIQPPVKIPGVDNDNPLQ